MANIAIDFDGTIVTHEFPRIGRILPGAAETIAALHENGHKIFLWTMRGYHPDHKRCLEEAVTWLEERDVVLDNINRTTSTFSTTSHKQHANLYIDDASIGCPLCAYPASDGEPVLCADWLRISNILRELNYINTEQHKRIYNVIINTYNQQDCPYKPHHWPVGPKGLPTAR